MKLQSLTANNFSSYPSLEFNFSNLGLTLVHGKTGAGKSTLLDAACWTLYGETAKQGASDDVRPFYTKDTTKSTLTVETASGIIEVTRTRGPNDLYWKEVGKNETIRGKDQNETQKLLSKRLGADADTFITASYYHELSPAANFFLAKAKDRKELFEKLADLEFPKTLDLKLSEAKKETKHLTQELALELAKVETIINETSNTINKLKQKSKNWETEKTKSIVELSSKAKTFNVDQRLRSTQLEGVRAALPALDAARRIELTGVISSTSYQLEVMSDETCKECGNLKNSDDRLRIERALGVLRNELLTIDRVETKRKELTDRIEAEKLATNTYEDQAKAKSKEKNPFSSTIKEHQSRLDEKLPEAQELKTSITALAARLSQLEELSYTTTALRGELLKRAVNSIKEGCNSRLERFFDSELKVDFQVGEGDTLDIDIQKSGNTCNFKQLSKGQRQLLRLCFSLSVMEAASNKAGQDFNLIMLDEPSDGVDPEIKFKSYALFEDLALKHESVLVIEHSTELKTMFENSIQVTMEGDTSCLQLQ